MWPFCKKYSNWKLVSENIICIEEKFNPLFGLGIIRQKIFVDVYMKKNKKTNYPKYKFIKKPFFIKTIK